MANPFFFAVLISGCFFSFTPVVAKWFLLEGIGILPFCIFYVAFRVLLQLPFVLKGQRLRIPRNIIPALFFFGCVGAGLRIGEITGISEGLPIAVVSILLYSHPIWTVLTARVLNKERFSSSSLLKIGIASLGIFLVSGFGFGAETSDLPKYLGPLGAAFLMALWICLSKSVQTKGCDLFTMAFYYDFFSLLVLVGVAITQFELGMAPLSESLQWLLVPRHFWAMVLYAALLGVFPNYLFYYGARNLSSITTSLVLLLDPLMTAAMASVMWGEFIPLHFVAGALLILATNIPPSFVQGFYRRFRERAFFRYSFPKSTGYVALPLEPPLKEFKQSA